MTKSKQIDASKQIERAKHIEQTKNEWMEDDNYNNYNDYLEIYKDKLYKLRYYILKHRENSEIYNPISKCISKTGKDIILFNKYIYSRLEIDAKFSCSNYRKSIRQYDLLSFGKHDINCIKDIANLINNDNQIMEHWIRTLYKLEKFLEYWITIKIPIILDKILSKKSSEHYSNINGFKDKKLYIDTVKNNSKLIKKSKLSFVYLEETRKLYSKIKKQLNFFKSYKINLTKLKICTKEIINIKGPFIKYFNIWPSQIEIEEDINLNKFFADVLENADLKNLHLEIVDTITDMIPIDTIANNKVYNNYLDWLSKYKQKISSKNSHKILDTILPNHYINIARNEAKKNEKKIKNKK